MSQWPWGEGVATGIGSLPGEDIVEAAKLVVGELPGLPHLPELPQRGPGADMIGRGAGLLTGLPVELYAGQWRVASHAGRDLRRTRDLMERDLDALSEAASGYAGPLKVQAPGPWTLAASLDLPVGGRLLRDHGAVADLVASLAEGLATHLAEVARRIEGATVVLQLDEPLVPAVLSGRVPTESGLRTLRSVPASTVESSLGELIDTVAVPVILHCCAADPPLPMFARLAQRSAEHGRGRGAVAVDLGLAASGREGMDELGALIDAGVGLFAGVVRSTGAATPSAVAAGDAVTAVWRSLGFAPERAARQVVVTPTCGLDGATPGYARAALAACVEAGRRLATP